MKFPVVPGSFVTPFFKPISDEDTYKAIVNHLYDCLTIDELKNMKMNKKELYTSVKF